MKMMRKSRVTHAVTAAVFAAGLSTMATAPVMAEPVNNPDGVGSTLLYPYYTTENDHSTLIHLVNTSSTHSVVAKVRLREYTNSEDVLDFTVVLSPKDVFAGYVKQGANGPVFVKTDNSCTSPNVGGKNAEIAFTGAQLDTAHTGHIEVITMAVINNSEAIGNMVSTSGAGSVDNAAGTLAQGALHDSSGLPADCAAVDNLFSSSGIGALQESVGNLDSVNGETQIGDFLTGHYSLLNTMSGYAGGGRPLALADSDQENGLVNPCYAGSTDSSAATVGNLLCGQFSGHYFVPNIGNLNGIDGTQYNGSNAGRFVQLEQAIAGTDSAPNIHNEWSGNAANGVSSELVFTLPLKHIYMDSTAMSSAGTTAATVFAGGEDDNPDIGGTQDCDANGDGAATNLEKCDWDDVDDAVRGVNGGIFTDLTGCVNYTRSLVDREESNTTPGTSASGPIAASIGTQICNETQVFTFGGGVTNPDGAAAINTSALNEQFGWFNLTLSPDSSGKVLSQAVANTGFGFWKRDFGNPSLNFGQIISNTRN